MADDSFNILENKAKSFSSDESATNVVVQEKKETFDCPLRLIVVGTKEKHEIEDEKVSSENDVDTKLDDNTVYAVGLSSSADPECVFSQFVNENNKDSAKYEVGLCGLQEFGGVKKILGEEKQPVEEEAEMDSVFESYNKGLVDSCITVHENELCEKEEIIPTDAGSLKEEIIPTDAGSLSCAMKFDGIDDAALIEPASASRLGYSCEQETGFVGFANHQEKNGNENNMKQDTDGKKEKRSRKRGKGSKKCSRMNGDEKAVRHQNVYETRGDGSKKIYPRKVLEALRFANVEEQKKKWTEVYCGLEPAVAEEYKGLVESVDQKHLYVDFDPRKHFMKKKASPAIRCEEFGNLDSEIENMNHLDPACGLSGSDVDSCPGVVENCSEDDDSDAEYASIQRPALLVTGEPNFDAGPPQDGLEYLRRVRWEAEQIPRVKVARVERSKLNKEQTVYMPKIPDIAECPGHLMPSKQWEDVFLADFSELRLALSRQESSGAKIFGELQTFPIIHEECSHHLPDIVIQEDIDNLTSDKINPCQSDDCPIQYFSTVNENGASRSASSDKCSESGVSGDWPSLCAILGMDSVALVSMLRKRINLVETVSSLSKNDCAWLYALCATVDTPLDADTYASLRCLLRKCASLRAEKLKLDDEVVWLNILATISGKYFRQSES